MEDGPLATRSTGGAGTRLHSSSVLTSQYFSNDTGGGDWDATAASTTTTTTTSQSTTTTTTTGGGDGGGNGSNYFDIVQRVTTRSSASPSTTTSAVGVASSVTASRPSSRLRKRRHDSTGPSTATRTNDAHSSTPKRQRRSSRTATAQLDPDGYPSANRSPTQTTSSSTNIRRGRGRGNGGSRSSRSSSSRLKKPPPASSSSSVPTNLKKPPPGPGDNKVDSSAGKNEDSDDKEVPTECCICMDDVDKKDLASISGCTHRFCFGCIEKWAEQENKCPLCKKRFSRIDRVHAVKTSGKRGGGGKSSANKNTKRVKNRNQRHTPSSATIESLIASLSSRHSVLSRILLSGQPSPGSASGNLVRSLYQRPTRQGEGPSSGPRATASASATSTSSGARPGAQPRTGQSLRSFLSEEGRAAMSAAMSDDPYEIYSDLDDESDDENPFSAFLREISSHRGPIPRNTASLDLSMSISGTLRMPQAMRFEPPARQFASNAGEANAGQSLDNPLEIDDSDSDDSDDEVEVVAVRRPAVARDV